MQRPRRQDTFDLRDQIHTDDGRGNQQYSQQYSQQHQQYYGVNSEHSVMEDSSDAEGEDSMDVLDNSYGAEVDHDRDLDDDDTIGDYMSDSSSSLSIPNESIDFDLVYSLTNFAATVEGQASVVKGDSLFLMDDKNSYWWLVRVLKTQEVGYIPAENIETPFERLARLNRHRNVDLASATQAELESTNPAAAKSSRNKKRVQLAGGPAPPDSNSSSNGGRNVTFTQTSNVFRYPPAVWNEEDEDKDDESYEYDIEIEVAPVKDTSSFDQNELMLGPDGEIIQMDIDQSIDETSAAVQEMIEDVKMMENSPTSSEPTILRAAPPDPQLQQNVLHSQSSRERLIQEQQDTITQDLSSASNRGPMIDPLEATETKKLSMTPTVARDDPSPTQQSTQPQQQQNVAQPQSAQGSTGPGPLVPSVILQRRQEQLEQEKKRAREEIEAAEEAAARKRQGAKGQGRELGLGPAPSQRQGQPVSQQQNAVAGAGPGQGQQQTPRIDSPQKELVRTASQETRSSVGSGGSSGGAKLRKERSSDRDGEESENGGKEKKKKSGGVFAGLFSRRNKEKGSKTSIENIAAVAASAGDIKQRNSDESGLSSSTHSHGAGSLSPAPGVRSQNGASVQQTQRISPTPTSQAQPTQQQPQQTQQKLQSSVSVQVSQHTSQLRERDLQQQAMYSEYLKRSPSSPPEQPSYGTQAASLVMPTLSQSQSGSSPNSSGFGLGLVPVGGTGSFRTQGGRPGSLILSPAPGMEGQGGIGVAVPELSVIRVFAGKNLQSDATFKTVLLNASTTSGELIRQSMQRFRLAAGEDAADYYLTVKQVEGSSMRLAPDEKPLGVFEQLVEEAEQMPMRVKRSSMGSISSVASNLSAHPAIKKLPMNDFTDDSAVKFYLNRVSGGDGLAYDDEDEGVAADISSSSADSVINSFLSSSGTGTSGQVVGSERFTTPSVRFAMQVVIYPEELPDNMVFDPHTEAIVFKETLRERSAESAAINPDIPQHQRKKFFNFPKNITVAEVIELGLERFGILEGVVDGGDEVEDKLTKRRSTSRVRYTLTVQADGQERELTPSSKILDAFPRPPIFRRSSELKRRSVDSAQLLLGSSEDVQIDDPLFILRRAVAYRPTNSSRHHRLSAPLDELALSHLHRDSTASDSTIEDNKSQTQTRQPSRQEIIAAQRAASRANQKAAISLSAKANAQRGIDIVLPGNAGMLRSQRVPTDDTMRYSYTQPDGETYDVSDIVEEELRASTSDSSIEMSGSTGGNSLSTSIGGLTSSNTDNSDLLSGALSGNQPNVLINKVLTKIKNTPVPQSASASTFRSTSPSNYSESGSEAGSRATTPTAASPATGGKRTPTKVTTTPSSTMNDSNSNNSMMMTRTDKEVMSSSSMAESRSRSVTPTAAANTNNGNSNSNSQTHRPYQPSIESVLSDVSSDYRTAASGTPLAMASNSRAGSRAALSPSPNGGRGAAAVATTLLANMPGGGGKPRILIPKDEFGLTEMLAIIDAKAGIAAREAAANQGASSTTNGAANPNATTTAVGGGSGFGPFAVQQPLDEVDELMFGRQVDLEKVHPQIREVYANTFKNLQDLDNELYAILQKASPLF